MPPVPSKYRKYNTYQNPMKGLTITQKHEVRKLLVANEKKTMEKKQFVLNGSVSVLESNAYMINPLTQIAQGTTISQRVGSIISLDSLEVYFNISPATGVYTSFRFIAYWSDVESVSAGGITTVTNANILATLPIMSTASVASAFANTSPIDNNQCTIIRDINYTVGSQYSTQTAIKTVHLKIPLRRKRVTYLSNATGSFLEGKNLYFGVIPESPGGVVNTTTVGTWNVQYKVNFHE